MSIANFNNLSTSKVFNAQSVPRFAGTHSSALNNTSEPLSEVSLKVADVVSTYGGFVDHISHLITDYAITDEWDSMIDGNMKRPWMKNLIGQEVHGFFTKRYLPQINFERPLHELMDKGFLNFFIHQHYKTFDSEQERQQQRQESRLFLRTIYPVLADMGKSTSAQKLIFALVDELSKYSKAIFFIKNQKNYPRKNDLRLSHRGISLVMHLNLESRPQILIVQQDANVGYWKKYSVVREVLFKLNLIYLSTLFGQKHIGHYHFQIFGSSIKMLENRALFEDKCGRGESVNELKDKPIFSEMELMEEFEPQERRVDCRLYKDFKPTNYFRTSFEAGADVSIKSFLMAAVLRLIQLNPEKLVWRDKFNIIFKAKYVAQINPMSSGYDLKYIDECALAESLKVLPEAISYFDGLAIKNLLERRQRSLDLILHVLQEFAPEKGLRLDRLLKQYSSILNSMVPVLEMNESEKENFPPMESTKTCTIKLVDHGQKQ